MKAIRNFDDIKEDMLKIKNKYAIKMHEEKGEIENFQLLYLF